MQFNFLCRFTCWWGDSILVYVVGLTSTETAFSKDTHLLFVCGQCYNFIEVTIEVTFLPWITIIGLLCLLSHLFNITKERAFHKTPTIYFFALCSLLFKIENLTGHKWYRTWFSSNLHGVSLQTEAPQNCRSIDYV